MKKLVVVFEGVNGSGKSTQARRLKKSLEGVGRSCVILQDPGSSPLGVALRAILKNKDYPLDPVTQVLLFTAARRALVPVVQACQEDVVVLDRWWFSTFAYQGAQGVDTKWIMDLDSRCSHGFELYPRLSFFLDAPPEDTMQRVKDVCILKGVDRFEHKGLEFQRKVRKMYLGLVPEHLTQIHCQVRGEDAVAEDVWNRVKALLEG